MRLKWFWLLLLAIPAVSWAQTGGTVRIPKSDSLNLMAQKSGNEVYTKCDSGCGSASISHVFIDSIPGAARVKGPCNNLISASGSPWSYLALDSLHNVCVTVAYSLLGATPAGANVIGYIRDSVYSLPGTYTDPNLAYGKIALTDSIHSTAVAGNASHHITVTGITLICHGVAGGRVQFLSASVALTGIMACDSTQGFSSPVALQTAVDSGFVIRQVVHNDTTSGWYTYVVLP